MALSGAQLAHPAVVPQLLRRRDALFGAIVGPWNLSAAVDGLAADVGRNGVEGVQSSLGLALRQPTGSPRCAPSRPAAGGGRDSADLGGAAEGGADCSPASRRTQSSVDRRPQAARL